MTEIKSFPNNQNTYVGAEWVMKWLHGRTSGVFGADENLATSAVPGSMSIEVSDGTGWLSNDNGEGIVFWNDKEQKSGSKLTLTHDVADGALDRIDRIVVTWETTNYVALPTISILKGVPSSNPVPPSLTNNNVLRQISLRQQRIPAGSISLSEMLGTDERLDPEVCGIVTESVKVDTTTMQHQFNAFLQAIQSELSNIMAGSGFDPAPVRALNVIVYPYNFTEFSSNDDEEKKLIGNGYKFRASIPIENVIESMYPYLTFSVSDVENSGIGIANQFRCYNGGVCLYSDGIPNATIMILTAEFRKDVASPAPTYDGTSTLNLDDNDYSSSARAEIDGNSYGVVNANVSVGDDGVYNFTVL